MVPSPSTVIDLSGDEPVLVRQGRYFTNNDSSFDSWEIEGTEIYRKGVTDA